MNWLNGIVAILTPDSKTTIGTGFVADSLLERETLILTCTHVLERAGYSFKNDAAVQVRFQVNRQELTAYLAKEWSRPSAAEDVAVLYLTDPLPEGVEKLPLVAAAACQHQNTQAFGYPDGTQGQLGKGEILGTIPDSKKHVSYWSVQLRSSEITHGYSGAPVWSFQSEAVLGIVRAGPKPDDMGRQSEVTYVTTSETLVELCTNLYIKAQDKDKLTQYRQRILEETHFVELKGIPLPLGRDGSPREPRISLDAVYIHPQVVAKEEREKQEKQEELRIANVGDANDFLSPMHQIATQQYHLRNDYETDKHSDPISLEEALKDKKRIVALGTPGAGKSTILRYIARRYAEKSDEFIPIMVSLRDYATIHAQNPLLSLRQFALKQVTLGDTSLHETLEQAIEHEQVLWLLDALDEAYDLAGEILREINRLPGLLLLTSRPIGYSSNAFQSLYHFEILPLTQEDVDIFLKHWVGLLANTLEVNTKVNVNERIVHLQKQLKAQPKLQRLTRNPLLLTFLATLATRDIQPELPSQRVQLYGQYIDELLNWEIARRQTKHANRGEWSLVSIKGEIARRAARDGLCYLGWALHLHYHGGKAKTVPDKTLLIDTLATYFIHDNYPDATNLAATIIDFWQAAGMLDTWQIGKHTYLSFRHLTFEEYAVAWGLNRVWQRNSQVAWQFLFPRLHHYAWREPVLLLFGLMNGQQQQELLRSLLSGKSLEERYLHRDLLLAGTLIVDGTVTDLKLRSQVVARLQRLEKSRYRFRIIRNFALRRGIITANRKTLDLIEDMLRQIRGIAISRQSTTILSNDGKILDNPTVRNDSTATIMKELEQALFPYFWASRKHRTNEIEQFVKETLQQNGELTVASLTKSLSYGDSKARRSAAVILGCFEEFTAVPQLITALSDNDSHVRRFAAISLGEIGDSLAVPHLITALSDSKSKVRGCAASALGQIGDKVCVPYLVCALKDTNVDVRRSVAHALRRVPDPAAIPQLITALADSERDVRCHATLALGEIGENAAIPHLTHSLMTDSEYYVRKYAAEALGLIGGETVVPFLITALSDRDIDVRQSAIKALQKVGDKVGNGTVVPQIINAFASGESFICERLIYTLFEFGEASIPYLIESLTHENAKIRIHTARTLGEISNPIATSPLIANLTDSNAEVRQFTAMALGQIGDDTATPYLINALSDDNEDVRSFVVHAIGQIGDKSSFTSLVNMLKDKNYQVRLAITQTLLPTGGTAAIPHLIMALNDRDEWIRYYAAQALMEIGDVTTIPTLIIALADKYNFVRETAAQALRIIAKNIVDIETLQHTRKALRQRITDDDHRVAFYAADALDQIVAQITVLQVANLPFEDPLC